MLEMWLLGDHANPKERVYAHITAITIIANITPKHNLFSKYEYIVMYIRVQNEGSNQWNIREAVRLREMATENSTLEEIEKRHRDEISRLYLYNKAIYREGPISSSLPVLSNLNHSDDKCPSCPFPAWNKWTRKPFSMGKGGTLHPPRLFEYTAHQMTSGGPPPAYQEVCQLFNSARSNAVWCKRQHVYDVCGMPHPEMLCRMRMEKHGRSRSSKGGTAHLVC